MSKYYRGFWNFAPLPECTDHTVMANNEDEATELLTAWAFAHRNCVDEPMDFEIEELDTTRFELAEKIVVYDARYNEYDGSIWEVYDRLANPKIVIEMICDYHCDRIYQRDVVEDFQTFTPRQRALAEESIKKIDDIMSVLKQLNKE